VRPKRFTGELGRDPREKNILVLPRNYSVSQRRRVETALERALPAWLLSITSPSHGHGRVATRRCRVPLGVR
jgi:hypothetical protein